MDLIQQELYMHYTREHRYHVSFEANGNTYAWDRSATIQQYSTRLHTCQNDKLLRVYLHVTLARTWARWWASIKLMTMAEHDTIRDSLSRLREKSSATACRQKQA